MTFKTPFLEESSLRAYSGLIAFAGALLFVSHPIQTSAVTYIYQRLASLAAFFYLLSLTAYARSRLSSERVRGYAFYVLAVISSFAAMKTKENAFTLPFVIVLYEFFFFTGNARRRLLRLTPLLLAVIVIPLSLAGMENQGGDVTGELGASMRGYEGLSRVEYLRSQFGAIVTYIRILFLPINQVLVYDSSLPRSFLEPKVVVSFLILLGVCSSGIYFLRRSMSGLPEARLVAFGIFWFFIALSVESSIVPLRLPVQEYRVYLPSFGAFLAVVAGALLLVRNAGRRKLNHAVCAVFLLVSVVFAGVTYARNRVWRSPQSLWEDVASKSPKYVEGRNNLGFIYWTNGLTDKAIEQYLIALELDPSRAKVHHNLGAAYGSKGLVDKGIEHCRAALKLKPDLARAHGDLATLLLSKGLTEEAIEHYERRLALGPAPAQTHFNLGLAYIKTGNVGSARRQLETALRIRPDFQEARRLLDRIPGAKQLPDEKEAT
jgi:tetratricopeptide (TPR) repeat protein